MMKGWEDLKNLAKDIKRSPDASNNIFEVLGVSSNENAHSNFLKWLFENEITCDLKFKVLEYLLELDEGAGRNLKIKRVTREEYLDPSHRIDLIIYCHTPDKTILIENKIFHQEGEDQTKEYRKAAEERFSGNISNYIFLTPLGVQASDSQHWKSKSHFRLAKIIKDFLANSNIENNEIKLILNSYVFNIHWTVLGMMEQKLKIIKNYYALTAEDRQELDNAWSLLPPYSIYTDIKDYLESLLQQNKISDRDLEISILDSDESIEVRSKNKKWNYGGKRKACYSFWLSPEKSNRVLLFLCAWGNKNEWWTDKEEWEKYGVEPLKKTFKDWGGLKLENTDWGANKNYASVEFSLNKDEINNLLGSSDRYDELIKELAETINSFIKKSKTVIEKNWIPKR